MSGSVRRSRLRAASAPRSTTLPESAVSGVFAFALNILTGNIEPDEGSIEIATDDVLDKKDFDFPRPWWRDLLPVDHFTPERIAHQGIGRTWQYVRLFPTHSLRDNVVLAMKNQTGENPVAVFFRRSTIRQEEAVWGKQADGLLVRFGLDGRETSSADMVSLGQSKRHRAPPRRCRPAQHETRESAGTPTETPVR